MMKLLFLSGLFGVSAAFAQAADHPAQDIHVPSISARQEAAIQTEIERLTAQFSDGLAETYSENPAIVRYGQLFEEHRHDAVVLFNLEGFGGGNHHAEFIAFFEEVEPVENAGKTAKPYRLVAVSKLGERGWRTFDFNTASIQNREVKLKGMAMRASDPMCCPSAPISKTFYVDEFDHIVEVQARHRQRHSKKP